MLKSNRGMVMTSYDAQMSQMSPMPPMNNNFYQPPHPNDYQGRSWVALIKFKVVKINTYNIACFPLLLSLVLLAPPYPIAHIDASFSNLNLNPSNDLMKKRNDYKFRGQGRNIFIIKHREHGNKLRKASNYSYHFGYTCFYRSVNCKNRTTFHRGNVIVRYRLFG